MLEGDIRRFCSDKDKERKGVGVVVHIKPTFSPKQQAFAAFSWNPP